MNVKSIERKGNEATVVVEIDKELMESGVNKAYMKARKSIQLPGFRKGKAPRKMIEAMYAPTFSTKTVWKRFSPRSMTSPLPSRISRPSAVPT